MKPAIRCLCALVLVSSLDFAAAQQNKDDLILPVIDYTVKVLPDLRSLEVTMHVKRVHTDHLRVAMPNWSPGAYRLHNAGKNVKDFEAVNAETGATLDALRIDHATWSIPTRDVEDVRVRYVVPPGRRRFMPGQPTDKPEGLHLQGPVTYMYVVGHKDRPVTCTYELPEGWDIANGMIPTENGLVRTARDYDTFIDCPTLLGHFRTKEFRVGATPFACVYFDLTGKYDFDLDACTDVVRRIVETEGGVFGSYPFFKYFFLFTVTGGGGGGGLEHLNSTSIGLSGPALKKDPNAIASITAHEFFHTWNVKRIRPKALGPFEYEHENYTGNLWVSEGWTSYYGDLSMLRAGINDIDAYLQSMSSKMSRELSKPRSHEHSVYWASRNVWHRYTNEPEGRRVDYYGKGEYLGFLIDLMIREKTDNKKSLDDVMRFLNRWFAERWIGFEEGDIERACTAVSNYDFSEFFARHVRGTVDPPIAEILSYAGLEFTKVEMPTALPFVHRQDDKGRLQVRFVNAGLREKGIQRGDLILAIDGNKDYDLSALLAGHQPGDTVTLSLQGRKKVQDVDVSLAPGRIRVTIRPMKGATPRQLRIRDGWMSGR